MHLEVLKGVSKAGRKVHRIGTRIDCYAEEVRATFWPALCLAIPSRRTRCQCRKRVCHSVLVVPSSSPFSIVENVSSLGHFKTLLDDLLFHFFFLLRTGQGASLLLLYRTGHQREVMPNFPG